MCSGLDSREKQSHALSRVCLEGHQSRQVAVGLSSQPCVQEYHVGGWSAWMGRGFIPGQGQHHRSASPGLLVVEQLPLGPPMPTPAPGHRCPTPADTRPFLECLPPDWHCATLASAAGCRPNAKTASWADSHRLRPGKLPTLGTV